MKNIYLLALFATLTVPAYADSGAMNTVAQASATEVMTVKKWQALPKDDKELLIEGIGVEKYANLKQVEFSDRNAISLVKPPMAHAFAVTMEDFMRTNSNLDVEDEHSRIGAAYVYWVNVLYIDDQVLGGSIGFIQDGCDMADDNWQYFETRDEAKIAGCDVEADVSWQAHALFDLGVTPIEFDEYMEWSGY